MLSHALIWLFNIMNSQLVTDLTFSVEVIGLLLPLVYSDPLNVVNNAHHRGTFGYGVTIVFFIVAMSYIYLYSHISIYSYTLTNLPLFPQQTAVPIPSYRCNWNEVISFGNNSSFYSSRYNWNEEISLCNNPSFYSSRCNWNEVISFGNNPSFC